MKGLLLGVALGLTAGTALAATGVLPVGARLVQCGERDNLATACKQDDRCCGLAKQMGFDVVEIKPETLNEIEPAAGPEPEDTDGFHVQPERTEDGEVINFE